jgi:hypothetical protein
MIQKEVKMELRKVDLPRPFTFESNYISLEVFLQPASEYFDASAQKFVKVPDSEVRIRFKGTKWNTQNSQMLKMVMESNEFTRGIITIDKEDPTGVWRELGYLKVKQVPVVSGVDMIHPVFDAELLKAMKGIAPTEEKTPVEPIRKVS